MPSREMTAALLFAVPECDLRSHVHAFHEAFPSLHSGLIDIYAGPPRRVPLATSHPPRRGTASGDPLQCQPKTKRESNQDQCICVCSLSSSPEGFVPSPQNHTPGTSSSKASGSSAGKMIGAVTPISAGTCAITYRNHSN
jgi:hypothetical protein